jgi:hypothetical protein
VVYVVAGLGEAGSGGAIELGYLLREWSPKEILCHGLFLLPAAGTPADEPAAANAYHALEELAYWMRPDTVWSQRLPGGAELKSSNQPSYGLARLLQPAGHGDDAFQASIAAAAELVAAVAGPSGGAISERDDATAGELASQPVVRGRHAALSLAGCAALTHVVDAQRQAASGRLLSQLGARWLSEKGVSTSSSVKELLPAEDLEGLVTELIAEWRRVMSAKPTRADAERIQRRDEADEQVARQKLYPVIQDNRNRLIWRLCENYQRLVRRHLTECDTGPTFLVTVLRKADEQVAKWADQDLEIQLAREKNRLDRITGQLGVALRDLERLEKEEPAAPKGLLAELRRQQYEHEHHGWSSHRDNQERKVTLEVIAHQEVFARYTALQWIRDQQWLDTLGRKFQIRKEVLECLLAELRSALSQQAAVDEATYEDVLRFWGLSRALTTTDPAELEGLAIEPLLSRAAQWRDDQLQKVPPRQDVPLPGVLAGIPLQVKDLVQRLTVEAEQLLDTAGANFHIAQRLDRGTIEELWNEANAVLAEVPASYIHPGQRTPATWLLHSGTAIEDEDTARLCELEEYLRSHPSGGTLKIVTTGDPYRILVMRELHGIGPDAVAGVTTAGSWRQTRGVVPCAHARTDVEWDDPLITRAERADAAALWLLCLLLGRPTGTLSGGAADTRKQFPVPEAGWYCPRSDGFFLVHHSSVPVVESGLLLPREFDHAVLRLLQPYHDTALNSIREYLAELKQQCDRPAAGAVLKHALREFDSLQLLGLRLEEARNLLQKSSHLHPWSHSLQ